MSGDLRILAVASCCRNRAYVITRKWSVVTTGPGNRPPSTTQPACPSSLKLIGSPLLKPSEWRWGGAGAEEVAEVTRAWHLTLTALGAKGGAWANAVHALDGSRGFLSVCPAGPRLFPAGEWEQLVCSPLFICEEQWFGYGRYSP